jgi:uncharacterized protein YneF (UPF0154 family)
MNKFLTTIGLALVTLAAIWGGFWLTNRSSQSTTETMSMPAVSEQQMMDKKMAQSDATVNDTMRQAQTRENVISQTTATGEALKEDAAAMANKTATTVKETAKNVTEGVANMAGDMKNSAANVANNLKNATAQSTNNLAKEAESMGISHEQAMLLPNLGSGWHVVGKADNGIKIKDMKSGMMYVAQCERKGNTKHTILRNPETGAQVREFTAQMQ